MSPPVDPPDPGDWPPPDDQAPWSDPPESEPDPRPEPLLWKVLRSTIAPDVLSEAGHDAPLSPRGRLLFWGTVAVLVLAIGVLFVVTVSK